MPLSLDEKVALAKEISALALRSHSVIAAEYRGLKVSEMTEFRRIARESGVFVKIVKNTVARKALAETDFSGMSDGLVGPMMLAFSLDHPGAGARIIGEFAKSHEKLVVKLVGIGGTVYGSSELERVAKIPTRDQALAMLARTVKAPIEKFVRTAAEPTAKLARTLAAVRDQKSAA